MPTMPKENPIQKTGRENSVQEEKLAFNFQGKQIIKPSLISGEYSTVIKISPGTIIMNSFM